jgi:hypothetical protein
MAKKTYSICVDPEVYYMWHVRAQVCDMTVSKWLAFMAHAGINANLDKPLLRFNPEQLRLPPATNTSAKRVETKPASFLPLNAPHSHPTSDTLPLPATDPQSPDYRPMPIGLPQDIAAQWSKLSGLYKDNWIAKLRGG